MDKDYSQLWKAVASTSEEGKAVRTLAEILLDNEGRTFISSLERDDAELCIEILDRVSRDSYLLPLLPSQIVPSGHRGARTQNHREIRFLHRVEETCCDPWAIAKAHDNNGGN